MAYTDDEFKFPEPDKKILILEAPVDLHPSSLKLVEEFSTFMAEKLKRAQDKYGYSDGWLTEEWKEDCLKDFKNHIDKGDPMDVAIYAAFMWKRGWSTNE